MSVTLANGRHFLGKRHSTYRRLFTLLCLMVLLTTLLMGLSGFLAFSRYTREEYIRKSREVLDQTRFMVEETMRNIERETIGSAMNSNINRYLMLPQNPEDVYPLWTSIVDTFSNRRLTSDYFDSIYLYALDNTKKILSNNGAIERNSFVDTAFIQSVIGSVVPRWSGVRKFMPFYSVSQGFSNVISYAQPVPGISGSVRGYLVVNLDLGWLTRAVDNVAAGWDGEFIIVDTLGQVLASSSRRSVGRPCDPEILRNTGEEGNGSVTINTAKGPRTVVYQSSPYYGWRYIHIVRFTGIFGDAMLLKFFSTLSVAFSILGILLAFGISSYFLKPLRRLINTVSSETSFPVREDEIGYLDHSFHRLKVEYDDYAAKYERTRCLIQQAFYHSLLDGSGFQADGSPIQQPLDTSGKTGPFLIVCFLARHPYTGASKSRLEEYWVNSFSSFAEKAFFLEYLQGLFVLVGWDDAPMDEPIEENVAGASSEMKPDIVAWLHESIRECASALNIHLSAVIPPPAGRIREIPVSFREARKATAFRKLIPDYAVLTTDRVLSASEDERALLDFDRRIIGIGNRLRTAGRREILQETGDFVNRVLDSATVNLPQKQALLYQLIQVAQTSVLQMNGSLEEAMDSEFHPYLEFEALKDPAGIREWFEQVMAKVHSYLESRRSARNEEMVGDILNWARENYREEMFTELAAEKFHLSEPYFCKLVRDYTGNTFGDIVAEIRVEAAIRELQANHDPLDDISRRVGFGCKRNMYRAFAKVRGETPGAYRKRLLSRRY